VGRIFDKQSDVISDSLQGEKGRQGMSYGIIVQEENLEGEKKLAFYREWNIQSNAVNYAVGKSFQNYKVVPMADYRRIEYKPEDYDIIVDVRDIPVLKPIVGELTEIEIMNLRVDAETAKTMLADEQAGKKRRAVVKWLRDRILEAG
jgi:hypothetical protein